jgi:4-oxalocrotonate tautomerase
MPIVTVEMYSGRTQREKDRLAEAITEDIAKILNAKREEVIIVFQEHRMEIGIVQEFVYNNIILYFFT